MPESLSLSGTNWYRAIVQSVERYPKFMLYKQSSNAIGFPNNAASPQRASWLVEPRYFVNAPTRFERWGGVYKTLYTRREPVGIAN